MNGLSVKFEQEHFCGSDDRANLGRVGRPVDYWAAASGAARDQLRYIQRRERLAPEPGSTVSGLRPATR